jgi:16S rRNA (cytidine1402-2'-O)-methyltransferase
MTLFIVATPIGNLGDMTYRAVETLKNVALVASEDTRTSRVLFQRYEIATPLTSFHAHSTERELERIVAELRAGKDVALISDAGTPGISDPGYRLIRAVIECGIKVSPIPGPSAVVTALSASGLPTDKFLYLGFLPLKKGRQTLLNSLKVEERTVVFYESVHRIEKTLCQLQEYLGGERKIVVARELTKLYEEFFRGTIAESVIWAREKKPRGEFVVLLGN